MSAPTIKRDLRYMREELGAPIQFSKARGGYCYAESPDADEHKNNTCAARQTRKSVANF